MLGAPAGSTSVGFTPDTPDSGSVGYRLFGDPPLNAGSTIEVGATLTGPDGTPLAGRTVHFDLEGLLKADSTFYKAWMTTWESDAVTNADGVAPPLAVCVPAVRFVPSASTCLN